MDGLTSGDSSAVCIRATNTVLAEEPIGWGITPFKGKCYIRRKYLRSGVFGPNFVLGLCRCKSLYA